MSAVAPHDAAQDNRRPGDSARRRQQRRQNLFMFVCLLALAAIFFGLTIVRMGGKG